MEEKPKRDMVLPASILAAGLMVTIALVYNAGKQPENPSGAAANLPSPEKMKPISADDHIFGNPNAPVKIVEFSDLECPYCKNFHATIRQIMSAFGDQVAWIFREYPIPELHPKASHEAQAAECAAKLGGNDKFWQFIDKIFEITPSNNGLDQNLLGKTASDIGINADDFNTCLSSTYGQDKIKSDTQDALNSGAEGTPYAIVVNGKGQKFVIPGALPFEQVSATVNQALK
jgi:protein-disulfide isomerase